MKKSIVIIFGLIMCLTCISCKQVQIFEEKEEFKQNAVMEGDLEQETYYVKQGTRFTKVYQPATNKTGAARKIDYSRIIYFNNDEHMIPEHYKGELIAYASKVADLKNVTLERYEDMGYSIGIYGGEMKDDGYYHFSVKKNTIENSQARQYFSNTESDNIRLVSVGGTPIGDLIDAGSGIIRKLQQGKDYTLEFYSGTYYYRSNFTADIHFLRAFELYNYDSKYISDTTHGYMCFSTPESLKSGYYNVNGNGLMLYHAYDKGEVVENENLNESYYANKNEMIASYSQQYNINLQDATKDMVIYFTYGAIKDLADQNMEIGAYLVAPDGTGYDLEVNETKQSMTITIALAMAGDWTLNITPKSLEISDINIDKDEVYEEMTVFEQTFEVTEDKEYQMFCYEVLGDVEIPVHGSIVGDNGLTYTFVTDTYRDEDGTLRRRMFYKIPYMKAANYKVKIRYYKSTNTIYGLQLTEYDKTVTDIYEFD